jgi:DNA-binding transcriptional LysR family regulator
VVQLQVSVMADLANAWLIRRLPSLHAQAPELDLHLRLHAEISPPDPYAVDVGIWHQRVDLPGFECHNLIEDYVIAVASPALLARYPGFTVADLPRLPMLRFALRPWRDWLLLAGLPPDEPVRGPIFQDAGLMLQSAVAGLGVATARAARARLHRQRTARADRHHADSIEPALLGDLARRQSARKGDPAFSYLAQGPDCRHCAENDSQL